MFPTVFLKPQMEQVLSLLSSGSTITEAATAAGVHRNTIMNWRRTSAVFQRRWHTMQYEQAMHWREQVQTLAPAALEALRQILEDRAALGVVKDRQGDSESLESREGYRLDSIFKTKEM